MVSPVTVLPTKIINCIGGLQLLLTCLWMRLTAVSHVDNRVREQIPVIDIVTHSVADLCDYAIVQNTDRKSRAVLFPRLSAESQLLEAYLRGKT